jgi:hypothetical protein
VYRIDIINTGEFQSRDIQTNTNQEEFPSRECVAKTNNDQKYRSITGGMGGIGRTVEGLDSRSGMVGRIRTRNVGGRDVWDFRRWSFGEQFINTCNRGISGANFGTISWGVDTFTPFENVWSGERSSSRNRQLPEGTGPSLTRTSGVPWWSDTQKSDCIRYSQQNL